MNYVTSLYQNDMDDECLDGLNGHWTELTRGLSIWTQALEIIGRWFLGAELLNESLSLYLSD